TGAGLGERVERGQPLLVLHASTAARLAEGRAALEDAYDITDEPVATRPLVLEKVG
ncbi:MAG: Pyrimidine nucleoside phosphorylase C-terminal domain, partial [Frankiales bacterium]|nr:Pyrimidine nucleoside phosphorylase C-terminal domain [Frankiales bacterium]